MRMIRLRLALVMDLVIRGSFGAISSLDDNGSFDANDLITGGRGNEKMGEGGTPGLAHDSIS